MEESTKKCNNLAQKMIDILGLKASPVAVALSEKTPENINKGIPERHCEMIQRARLDKTEFYTTVNEHTCKGGAAVMGLMDLPENVANGDFYYKLGAFSSPDASKNTIEKVPKIENKANVAVYAPLDRATFTPDIVVVICNPKQAMQIVQADLYEEGGRIETGFAGKQSLCGDIVAQTLNSNSIQVSLACSGSRKHAKIAEDELIVGIPVNRMQSVVNSLDKLFNK